MFCKQCGNELKDGTVVCANCGVNQDHVIDFERTVNVFETVHKAQPVSHVEEKSINETSVQQEPAEEIIEEPVEEIVEESVEENAQLQNTYNSTSKEMLASIINQELEKYEQEGHKIKLKSIVKKRKKYSIICGIIAFLGLAQPAFVFVVPVYAILMLMTRDNVRNIISLMKKSPDKSIEQIMAEQIQKQ